MEADSAARGFVGYLASQQLADSLAKAKMEIAQAKPDPVTGDKPREMTKEEKDQMRQACDMIKNFDLGKALAGAWDQMKRELGNAVVESAKQGAMGKLRGLIKKPRIP